MDLKEQYNNLRRTTIALALILLVIILLSIIAFYKGWLGAPGKIYFSPENEVYVKCAGNENICGELGVCEKVMIVAGAGADSRELEDYICLTK